MGAAMRLAGYAVIAIGLIGCATPKNATVEKAYQLSRETQDKAIAALSKFYNCTNEYSQKNWAHLATATEIGDSAVASCKSFLDSFENLMGASYQALVAVEMSYYQMSMAELHARDKQAWQKAKSDADRSAQQAKALSVKFVIEVRAKAEKGLRDGPKQDKEQSPAPQPPAKGA